jgi:hypothetical protein
MASGDLWLIISQFPSVVTCQNGTARAMVMRLSECLCCLGPSRGTALVTMVWASHLELHVEAVRRVHSTFIFEFSLETHKLEVALKPWKQGSSMLVRQEFNKSNWP